MQVVTFQDIAQHYTFYDDVEPDDNKYVVCLTQFWKDIDDCCVGSYHIFVSDAAQLLILYNENSYPIQPKTWVSRYQVDNFKVTQKFIDYLLDGPRVNQFYPRKKLNIPHIYYSGFDYNRVEAKCNMFDYVLHQMIKFQNISLKEEIVKMAKENTALRKIIREGYD